MSQNNYSNQHLPVPSLPSDYPDWNKERIRFVREASPAGSLRDYMSIFFKHKLSVLISALVISAIGIGIAILYNYYIYTPTFKVRSLVLVKFGWENYSSPDLSLESRRNLPVNQNEIIGSETRILQSRELKNRVINVLKPEGIYSEIINNPIPGLNNAEVALIKLEKDLTVTSAKNSNVIEVSLDGTDPGRAAAVVNQLVNLYIERRTEIYKDPKSALFLEKKANEFAQKLADSESKLKAFRNETQIVSFDEQRSLLLKQQVETSTAYNNTANQVREVQEKISELEKQSTSLQKTAPVLQAGDTRQALETKLLDLCLKEKELLSKFREDNPLVANIREQIKMTQEVFDRQNKSKGASADPLYQDLLKQIMQNKAELTALRARGSSLEQQRRELNEQIQAFEASENKNKELMREVSTNEERYRNYRHRLEESRIFDELERQKMTSVSVIEPAVPTPVPSNPKKPLILLILGAIAAGLFGSLGFALFLEKMDQSLSTPTEVEKRLDLPVLVAIPLK